MRLPRDRNEALGLVAAQVHRYADRGPYHLFPDEVVVRNLLDKLADNLLQHGLAYCPCRPVTGDPQQDRVNVCPCASHHEDIARDGHCECRLYVSSDYLEARRNPEPDPGG